MPFGIRFLYAGFIWGPPFPNLIFHPDTGVVQSCRGSPFLQSAETMIAVKLALANHILAHPFPEVNPVRPI